MGNIPNWPLLVTQWGPANNANGGSPAWQNADLSNRVLGSIGYKVGKQYELDTAQAGELTVSIRNNDAVLDPTNTSSPYAGYINPYQPFSVTAQYPASVNLLTAYQANAIGSVVGTIATGHNVYSSTDSTGGSVVYSSGLSQNIFQFAVPTSSVAGSTICYLMNLPCQPGEQYTFSTNVASTVSGSNPAVQLVIAFYEPPLSSSPASWNVGTVTTLSSAGTPYSLSETVTAPANASGMAVGLVLNATVSVATNVQMWQSQVQYGAGTAYAQPGTWYSLFTGFVERWPTKWKPGGQYGTIAATVVDAMALMSQGQLSDPLTNELNGAGASWTYKLNDPSGSDTCAEANGKFPPIAAENTLWGGIGTLTFGNAITATNPVTGIFTAGGTTPACVSIAASGNGTTYLSLDQAGIKGPQTPALYTRMIAFRYTGPAYTTPTSYTVWSAFDSVPNGTGNQIVMGFSSSSSSAGSVFAAQGYSTGQNELYDPSGFNPCDGNWHLMMFGFDAATSTVMMSVDGHYQSSTTANTVMKGFVKDSLGGDVWVSNQGVSQFTGDIAYAAEFPSLLTSTQCANIYSAWYNACAGESSGARYARVARYGGYTGPISIDPNVMTTSMGPGTDMSGSDALTCLNNIVVTENGNHYVASNGTLTFTGREFRYNRGTPAYIFGENQAGGEWPYEDLQLDYDTTHLANDVTVTLNATSQNFYAINPTSQTAVFDRTMTRTVNCESIQEAQAAASWLAWRYSTPLTRVQSVTLNPAALNGLWPVCLSIDVNTLIQINRRPPGCPEISLLLWVENKQWTLDDKGNAKLVLQCSPAIPVPQAQFAVWNSTLVITGASAGANNVSIHPCQDDINPLTAQLRAGQQLIVDAGGTNPEVMTVKSTSVTGSNPWTSGNIVFTTNLAYNHTGGSIVQEYSASAPNPTEYEPNSVLNSVMLTY